MLSERMLSTVVRETSNRYLNLSPTTESHVPAPVPGKRYMLYAHVPFCERLCPYCSFNRFPLEEQKAHRYFANLRKEMLMLKDLGYDFDSLYVGGGTPTILIDELCDTIDLARETFSIKEVSSETNPNHLIPSYLDKLQGRVQRLSVGVQSFDDGLLKQMDRYEKYGCGAEIMERIQGAYPYFVSMNVDMIFNFPAQTEDILISDIEKVIATGTTQTTFYPLMASPSVEKSLAATVGKVDYDREYLFYRIICDLLAGERMDGSVDPHPFFSHGSAWTFNRNAAGAGVSGGKGCMAGVQDSGMAPPPSQFAQVGQTGQPMQAAQSEQPVQSDQPAQLEQPAMIDEYVVNYEEYPAIGSGGITYLGSTLFVNTFSVNDYNEIVESGRMSLMGKTNFSLRERMRYRFMMQLFGLRLDKEQFRKDFGVDVEVGLPLEMEFMRRNKAFEIDNDSELTLTAFGRYLLVVMMRQFFIGVNNLRDQARAALTGEERVLIFGDGCTEEHRKHC